MMLESNQENTEIYLIFDKNWGKDLFEISRTRHIWICNSESNDSQISETWGKDNKYNPNKGVTSFRMKDTIENEFYNIIGMIDDHHHNGFENINEWKEIIVFGVDRSKIKKSNIERILGYEINLEDFDEGFKIVK